MRLSLALAGRYCIVPSRVNFVSAQPYLVEFFVRDCDSDLVIVCIQHRFDFEPGSRLGATDEINDRFIVDQRLSLPVQTDKRKEPVLDLYRRLTPPLRIERPVTKIPEPTTGKPDPLPPVGL